MRAMILAAGRGTRMGPLTIDTPKPLLDLNGESLLGRHLRMLRSAGIREVIVNVSYLGEKIQAALGDGARYGVDIRYSQEPDEPLETAGGIIQALPLLGSEPFVVVNADIVCDFEFAGLGESPGAGTLVLVPNPAHNPEGDFGLDSRSRLNHAPPKWTFAGISRLSPELFTGLAPGRRPLVQVLNAAIERGALVGMIHSGLWMDVGTPERLQAARSALAQAG
jgi:MurNAc alpha-1-phosphate uridylyltransferase